jgi:hypothetical protein
MATPPDFTTGQVLTAAQMSAVGLWLVKTQTVGATVPNVTVTDAFSADYDNYKILYTGGTASGAVGPLNMSLGASTTGYYSVATYGLYSGTTGIVNNNNTLPYFYYAGAANNVVGNILNIDVMEPFNSGKYTHFNGFFNVVDVAGTTGGYHAVNASYTSFTLTPGTGTISGGVISVYGYR